MAYFVQRGASWFAQIRRKGHKSLSKSFPTKTLAVQWAREQEALIDAKKYNDTRIISKITFGQLIDEYRAEVEPKKPFGRTKAASLEFLKKRLGHVPLSGMTQARITEYINERKAEAGGVTISIDLTYIATVLKAGKVLFKYPVSPDPVNEARHLLRYDGIRTKSTERDRRPTEYELRLIYAHYEGKRLLTPMPDIIRFAIASAMRLGEITRIRWADVNRDDRTVIIRDRKDPKAKQGNDQEVPLLGEAWDIVMRQPEGELIFPHNPASISSSFTRAVKATGIDDLHFHDLRHEGISRLFEQGYRIEHVALVSGHKDIRMLFRYVQLRAKDLHRA